MKRAFTITLLAYFFFPLFTSAQSPGNALDFDGSNDLISLPLPGMFDSLATQDITVETWIYPRSTSFARIFYAQQSGSEFFNFAYSSQSIYFYVVRGGTTYSANTSASSVPLNQWTHVACRWTAATNSVDIFLNGVAAATTGGGSSTSGTNGLLSIASRPGGAQYFNGQIDEMRVWREARSECSIAANYQAEFSGPVSNLAIYYDYNQGAAGGNNSTVTTLMDQSGFGYNGTLSGLALNGTGSNWIASTAGINQLGPSVGAGYTINDTISVCPGTVYTFPDNSTQTITTAITQTSMFTAANLCDSIINTTVNLFQTYSQNDTIDVCPGTMVTFPDGSSQTITAPTTQTSILSTANACDSTIITMVNLAPTYTVNDSAAVCIGSSYTFPDGSTQSNIQMPVTYTSALSTAQGCDSIVITSLAVTQNDTSVTVTGVPVSLLANQANATYQWLDCNNNFAPVPNANAQVYLPLASGSYAVEITANGCTDTSMCNTVTIVGISELLAFPINVYPNPAQDRIRVETGELPEGKIALLDLRGKIIGHYPTSPQETIIDLMDIPAGIYFLRVTMENRSKTVRFVKQ